MLTVVAGLLVRDGRILACRRRPEQDHGSKWEFPGGKAEADEDPRDALVRELREELAVEATVGNEFLRYEFRYTGKKPIELIFYWVTAYNGALDNAFFAETRWIAPIDLVDLDFLEGDTRVVAELASRPLR